MLSVPSAFWNRCVFSVFLKLSALSDRCRRSSGSAFQAIGPAMENARQPSMLRRCRGTTRWWRLEDWSRWRLATSDVGWEQFTRYWGALPWRHRWTVTPSLWRIRWGTLSQCSSEWSRCVKPRSNFPVTVHCGCSAQWSQCTVITVHNGHSALWLLCTMVTVHCGCSAQWSQCTVITVHNGHSALWL